MHHRLAPPHRLQVGLLVIRAGALALVVLAGLWTPPYDEGGGAIATAPDLPPQVQLLIERHDCSTTGFATAAPASALIRSRSGHLRLVSYDRGWEVFTDHGSAQLIAVCLDDPPTRGG
ncbi:hypothetical protein [Nocardioides sp. URHA0020]|uniref:hypothetical protein n=1 Tax=Nocardioides sp. URHA0020 TaxID=1380392 RepID=UPI00048ECD1B|nr:hypothetical protein [Nocardioides sp. URHA0020]